MSMKSLMQSKTKIFIFIMVFIILVSAILSLFYFYNYLDKKKFGNSELEKIQNLICTEKTIHDNICCYLETNFFNSYTVSWLGYEPICDYYFVDVDESFIYLYCASSDYCLKDGKILRTNSSQMPVRIKYIFYQNDNSFEFLKVDSPSEGNRFTKQYKKYFPEEVRLKMSFTNDEYEKLEGMTDARACEYWNVDYVVDAFDCG